jgi:hypothetical protein
MRNSPRHADPARPLLRIRGAPRRERAGATGLGSTEGTGSAARATCRSLRCGSGAAGRRGRGAACSCSTATRGFAYPRTTARRGSSFPGRPVLARRNPAPLAGLLRADGDVVLHRRSAGRNRRRAPTVICQFRTEPRLVSRSCLRQESDRNYQRTFASQGYRPEESGRT